MVKFSNVSKIYNNKPVLNDINFTINDGEFVYLMGASGCGKTTIFKLIYHIDESDSGEILIDHVNITKLKDNQIPELRRQIGVVFQDYKLIGSKTVYENISLVLEVIGKSKSEISEIVNSVLKIVNLSEKGNLFPSQLSGGEKQRVAIARAIVTDPSVLLADEPTGNLDANTAKEIMTILRKINNLGTTVIMATHDDGIVKHFPKRVIKLVAGLPINDVLYTEYHQINTIDDKKQSEAELLTSKKNDTTFPKTKEINKNEVEYIKPLKEHRAENDESKIEEKKSRFDFFSKFIPSKPKTIISNTDIPKKTINQRNIEESKLQDKVKVNSSSNQKSELKTKNQVESESEIMESSVKLLNIPNELQTVILKKGINMISELEKMNDATLSRIVGVINVWKIKQAIINFKKNNK
jgi:cell division transport system ATP-binding protein